jgi:hypothetical protein
MNQQLEIAHQYFENYVPNKNDSWEIILEDCRTHLENNLEDSLADIIMDMVIHQGKEIMEIMSLEEN